MEAGVRTREGAGESLPTVETSWVGPEGVPASSSASSTGGGLREGLWRRREPGAIAKDKRP